MLVYGLIVFAVAALGGLTMALFFVLRGRLAPWALSLLHAGLGAVGLLLLLFAALTVKVPTAALIALLILIVAALGGFYLASIHLQKKVAPKPIVFVHGGAAVIGFVALLGAIAGWF